MTPDDWELVTSLFHAAAASEGSDRAAFLAAQCQGREDLRLVLEGLLAEHDHAGSFLERPASSLPTTLKFTEPSGDEDIGIGQNLSHYQVTGKLGQGGMGVVYHAIDLQLQRPVAIKVLRRGWLHKEDLERRFLREARAAAALNHPNICHIYEISEVDGIRFIVMEYIRGQTLAAAIAAGRLNPADIVRFGAETAEALATAHGHGMIHRDIKPANLMIGPRNELKVLDFGLAKVSRADVAPGLSETSLTQTGFLMGTVAYMSPEQLLGKELDHRSDIFSLGLVLYEMATGRRAFQGTSTIETIDKVLHSGPEPIDQWPELDRIIRKCTEKERERRYQSAREIGEELRRAAEGSGAVGRFVRQQLQAIPSMKDKSVRRVVLITALASGVVLTGILAIKRFTAPGTRRNDRISPASTTKTAISSPWDQLTFEKIAALGDPAPGGGSFTKYFQPSGPNNQGDLTFVTEVSEGSSGEAVFLSKKGVTRSLLELARAGEAAPGGGILEGGTDGVASINDAGDVAFSFGLKPAYPPELKNIVRSALYRYSHLDASLTAVAVPGVTAAPGYGVFESASVPRLNNSGAIVFRGVVPTMAGLPSVLRGSGLGIFLADSKGHINKVLAPGDRSPGGGSFDYFNNPWINDRGDVAFGGHVAGEECITIGIGCGESIYLREAASRAIQSIAHQREQGPELTFVYAWGAITNNRGELAFMGELTAPGVGAKRGICVHSRGKITVIGAPAHVMSDGRKIITVNPGATVGNYSLNNLGEVCFNASLENGESAFYVYSQGEVHLVAGTGTVVPGVGTIAGVEASFAMGGGLNDRGQVLFWATLKDGRSVLLLGSQTPASK